LTGDWEHKLRLMARGQMQRADFMREIAEMTRHIVERAKAMRATPVPGDFGDSKRPVPSAAAW